MNHVEDAFSESSAALLFLVGFFPAVALHAAELDDHRVVDQAVDGCRRRRHGILEGLVPLRDEVVQ